MKYSHALSATVRHHGIRIASLQIGQLIERSAAAKLFDAGHFSDVEPGQLPRVDPDQQAEQLWTIAHSSTRSSTAVDTKRSTPGHPDLAGQKAGEACAVSSTAGRLMETAEDGYGAGPTGQVQVSSNGAAKVIAVSWIARSSALSGAAAHLVEDVAG